MDAAASGGGPSTIVLPDIVTGQPEAILGYAGELIAKAARLASHLAALERAREQLSQVWSDGSASQNVLTKLTKTFEQFNGIIETVNKAVTELGLSAAKVRIAQTAYTAVVNVVNPIVQALISNPWTYAAGAALATGATYLLKAFITAINAVMNIIGGVNIIKLLTDLVQIGQAISELTNSGADDNGAAAGNAAISASPVSAPKPMETVATQSGQSALNGGGYASGSSTGNQFGSTDLTSQYGYNPSALDPANSWIAVDPAGSGASGGGSATPNAGGTGTGAGGSGTGAETGGASTVGSGQSGDHDVVITGKNGDLEVTVEVPVDLGRDLDVDITVESDGTTIHEHIDVDADGSVHVR